LESAAHGGVAAAGQRLKTINVKEEEASLKPEEINAGLCV